MPWRTDIERYRVRRTLSEVKRKLEEALDLSQKNERAPSVPASKDEQQAAAHRHR
jgi:hypothetical protein